MNTLNPNWYLVWVGLTYPVAIVVIVSFSGNILAIDPFLLILLPVLTIAGVVLVWKSGNVCFHWVAVAGLVGWMGLMTWLCLLFFAMVTANV